MDNSISKSSVQEQIEILSIYRWFVQNYNESIFEKKLDDPWITKYIKQTELQRCCSTLLERARWYDDFFAYEFGEDDIVYLKRLYRQRDYIRFLDVMAWYICEYMFPKLEAIWLLTESVKKDINSKQDNWEKLKTLHFHNKKNSEIHNLEKEVCKITSVVIKKKFKLIISEAIKIKDPIESCILIKEISNTVHQVTNILSINDKNSWLNINLDNIEISILK